MALDLQSEVKDLTIDGSDITVRVGAHSRIDAKIIIEGDGHTLDIGPFTTIMGVIRLVGGNGSTVRIGHDTTMTINSSLHAMEGCSIFIGVDSQLSTGVYVSTSDMHPIFDLASGGRINAARDITIGDHVWVGRSASINKGVHIGSGSIIGNGAIVTGEIPANVIACGIPAKVVREGVRWTRDFPPTS